MDPDARLIALEEKLAYLEMHVGDLDEVVRDLAGRLDLQAKGVKQMRTMIEQHLAGGEGDKDDAPDAERDRPPHW